MTTLKRLLTLAISLALTAVDWLAGLSRRLVGRTSRPSCVVLMYHGVPTKLRTRFAMHMNTLLRWAQPIRADESALPAGHRHYAAITFDDGLQSTVDNALPELRVRHIPATLFVVTEALGCEPAWEHFKPGQERVGTIVSKEQLQSLPSELVTIGSHTMTHQVLSWIPREHVREELVGSRQKLETLLKRKVTLLSFPYGKYDQTVLDICHEANYCRVFSSAWHLAIRRPNEFLTSRVKVEPTDWQIEFLLKLLGGYRWLSRVETIKNHLRNALRFARGRTFEMQQSSSEHWQEPSEDREISNLFDGASELEVTSAGSKSSIKLN